MYYLCVYIYISKHPYESGIKMRRITRVFRFLYSKLVETKNTSDKTRYS